MFDDNHNNQFDGEFNEVEPENNSPESRDPKTETVWERCSSQRLLQGF